MFILQRGSLLLVLIQFQFQSHCHSSGWGGGGHLIEFEWEEGLGVVVGAYSNKYGSIPLFYRAVSGLVSRRCFTAGMSRTRS